MDSYRTKDELAKSLGVSKPTLIKFEKENLTDEVFCRAWYMFGKILMATQKLHTTRAKTERHVAKSPTVKMVGDDLEAAVLTLGEFAKYNPEITPQIYRLQTALDLLRRTDKVQ